MYGMRAGPVRPLREKKAGMFQRGIAAAVADLGQRAVIAQVRVVRGTLEQVQEKLLGRAKASEGKVLVRELAVCLGRQDFIA